MGFARRRRRGQWPVISGDGRGAGPNLENERGRCDASESGQSEKVFARWAQSERLANPNAHPGNRSHRAFAGLFLGLSRTTVSDALSGLPRVDPATAQRVRKAARDAGYVRNPLAGALMSELRRSRGSTFRACWRPWISDAQDRPPVAARYHRELQIGATERAAELGFKVELFRAGRGGVSVHRLDSILQSRGIHGLIFLPSWGGPRLFETRLDALRGRLH